MVQTQSPLTLLQTRDMQREINKKDRLEIWQYLDLLPSDYKKVFRSPETTIKTTDKGTRYTLSVPSKWAGTDIIFEGICLRDTSKGYMGWTRISYFLFDNLNCICYERSLIDEMNKNGVDDNLVELVFPDLK